MALELTLKPDERVIIGGAVIRHASKHSTRLVVETSVPILRSADILPPNQVQTPCARIYMAVQLLYIDPAKHNEYMAMYLSLSQDLLVAAPSTEQHLAKVSQHVANGRYYQALQEAKQLLKYERVLLDSRTDGPELGSESANKTKS